MDYDGSERTTRHAVAEAKAAFERGQRRVYPPGVVEPGLWFQWDWGHEAADLGPAHPAVVPVAGVDLAKLRIGEKEELQRAA